SRNRFSLCLKGFARGAKKIILVLSYPSDEVGNELVSLDALDEKGINPYSDTLTLDVFLELFGTTKHPFTGMDYVTYYQELIKEENCEVEVLFANDARAVLPYTKQVITCDIHTRARSKRLLKKAGAEVVLGLDEIMNAPIDGSGYNEPFGLLGSNKASEDTVKLFPRDSQAFVEKVQQSIFEKTGKRIEVMVYGDGAFKDPVGKIWELADPVVSPGYTKGLIGTPNEVKLKYLADYTFHDLSGEDLEEAIRQSILEKEMELVGKMVAEGTTPRRLTDLLGSLADLTSGSGDKGTPFVYIQGYFDNYTD
ncbi:MAG: coenzyme F420-0:L-glutamate ligase, partial [Solobacterium sp.]|nr:coenzyme F420-0:L-glutamate ligase [Solobacterium sp.]